METKINIAAILESKPQGTKLYSSACGKCTLEEADDKSFKISFYNSKFGFMNGGEGYLDKNGKLYDDGECVVFPSKEMRDWSKFAWKKGDILVGCAKIIIFDRFTDDTYSYFEGKYCLERDPYSDYETYRGEDKGLLTKYFHIPEQCIAQSYIKNIEERLGGNLYLETLEIEKTQPEFKEGDILCITDESESCKYISIYKKQEGNHINRYATMFEDKNIKITVGGFLLDNENLSKRYATDSEKQQLFEALAKKGKAWDAEKKQIVDLKPKCEFKPFDRCIWKIRNCEGSIWQASFVSYVDEYGATPMGMSIDEDLVNLIILPYNDQTKLLVGTTDEWKGGEQ